MQKIERKCLSQASIAGGTDKSGNATANADSTVNLSLSDVKIPKDASVSITINNGSSATATR
jgi:hypothetical protein